MTIVLFTNSIDEIRRLADVFTAITIGNPLGLPMAKVNNISNSDNLSRGNSRLACDHPTNFCIEIQYHACLTILIEHLQSILAS
jgi:hypothetical protein